MLLLEFSKIANRGWYLREGYFADLVLFGSRRNIDPGRKMLLTMPGPFRKCPIIWKGLLHVCEYRSIRMADSMNLKPVNDWCLIDKSSPKIIYFVAGNVNRIQYRYMHMIEQSARDFCRDVYQTLCDGMGRNQHFPIETMKELSEKWDFLGILVPEQFWSWIPGIHFHTDWNRVKWIPVFVFLYCPYSH